MLAQIFISYPAYALDFASFFHCIPSPRGYIAVSEPNYLGSLFCPSKILLCLAIQATKSPLGSYSLSSTILGTSTIKGRDIPSLASNLLDWLPYPLIEISPGLSQTGWHSLFMYSLSTNMGSSNGCSSQPYILIWVHLVPWNKRAGIVIE